MGPYNSGTFKIGQGSEDSPGGAVFFNSALYYFVTREGKLEIVVCTPPTGLNGWRVVSPSNSAWEDAWSRTKTSVRTKGANATPAVVLPDGAGGSTIYVVGGDSTVHQLGKDRSTLTPISIESVNGTALTTAGATAWGKYLIVAWYNSSYQGLMWEAYDTDDLPDPVDSDFVWKPAYESGAFPETLGIDGAGDVTSLEWFTGPPAADSSSTDPACYLVTSFMGSDGPCVLVSMMGNGPVADVDQGFSIQTDTGSETPVVLQRDPAGLVWLYGVSSYAGSGGGGPSRYAMSAQMPGLLDDPLGTDSPWTGDYSTLWQTVGDPLPSSRTPVGTFVLGPTYNLDATGDSAEGGTAADVYQVVFLAHDDDTIQCDIDAYGTAQQLPDYATRDLLPDPPPSESIGPISGIIDAPVPVPASNIANGSYASGQSLGGVTYGATETDAKGHTSNFSWSVGISDSFRTTAGAGPAWDISLSSGQTLSSGATHTKSFIETTSNEVIVNATSDSVEAYGTFFARGATYHYTWFRMVDLADPPQAFGQAALMGIVPTYSSARANSFPPFLVTPGDLASYTEPQINARAQQLGLVDAGTEYIADTIEPNAMAIGPSGEKYLQYSISENSQASAAYLESSDKWSESGWTLDSKVYAGISGGTSVSVGLAAGASATASVIGFSMDALAGTQIDASQSDSTDKSNQVQINLDIKWPAPVEPTDISRCDFRMYFVPKSSQAVNDLATALAGQVQVDTNSAPWRILFVVESYESQDGSISYP